MAAGLPGGSVPARMTGPGFTFGNLGDGSDFFYEDDMNDDSIPHIQVGFLFEDIIFVVVLLWGPR